jgi:peptide-methionine (S)-S-oxide reductase
MTLSGLVFKVLPLVLLAAVGVYAINAVMPSLGGLQNRAAGESAVTIPPPEQVLANPTAPGAQKIVLAGGCFWGVQGVYQHVNGVLNAVSGYAGGDAATAHYHVVGSGRTGHAEAVEVTFDPAQVSFGKILQIFFSVAHDPTQLDRQGPDYGTQYRSAIFAANQDQQQVIEAYIAQLDRAKVFPEKIVTEVGKLDRFYPAEDYHQDYMTLNPGSAYIRAWDLPKVAHLKRIFTDAYRDDPLLVSEAEGQ